MYYKDLNNKLHFLDSAEFEHMLPSGCVSITDDEAHALMNTKPIEQTVSEYTSAVQQRLDDFAKTRGYSSMLSACTYATSAVPKFQSEGQYCVNARDETWNACYLILEQVNTGKRVMPSLDELLQALPSLAWPN